MGSYKGSGLKKRPSIVNGIFYPETKGEITDMLISWGLKPGAASGGQIILAPHGKWDQTGSVAASAFKSLQQKPYDKSFKRMLLLGVDHNYTEEGIYLFESYSFETPQGDIEVDQSFNQILTSCSTLIQINDTPHLLEYSLEVLLPFVKHCFPEVKIIPVLMRGKRPMLISCLAKALRVTFENHMEESIILVSSNVSRSSDASRALSMAEEFSSILEAMDTHSFLTRFAAGNITACGAAILGALLESGLLDGKSFQPTCPMVECREESGETVYHGAFVARCF